MTTLGRHKGLLAMVLLFAFLFGGCGTAGENKFSLFNTILGNDTSAASADLSPTFSTYQDGHLYYIPLSGTSEGCLIDYDVQTGSSSRVYQSYSKNTAAEAMVSVVYHEGKIYGWIMSTTKDNAFSSNWDYVYGTLSKIDPLTYERSDYLFNDIISMLWYTGEAIYFVGRDSISANQRISLYRFDFEEETFTDILKDDTLSKQNNFDSTTECEIQRIKNGRIYFTYKSSGETHLCSVKTDGKDFIQYRLFDSGSVREVESFSACYVVNGDLLYRVRRWSDLTEEYLYYYYLYDSKQNDSTKITMSLSSVWAQYDGYLYGATDGQDGIFRIPETDLNAQPQWVCEPVNSSYSIYSFYNTYVIISIGSSSSSYQVAATDGTACTDKISIEEAYQWVCAR